MRKQLINSVENILATDEKSVLLLGDIGVFGFRNAFKNHPDRVYNIGILEQSTISLASGMAINGLIPFVHTIAPFMVERALEQIKIDFGYQNLNGNFISIGASYDYASLGGTHHCPGDVSQLLTIPMMDIIVAGTSNEFNSLINQSYKLNCPKYYRLSEYENSVDNEVVYGAANVIKKGKDATIICVGNMLQNTIEATKDMDVTILYYTTITPFDRTTLIENFNETLIIIEPFYFGTINHLVTRRLEGKKYRLFNIGVPRVFLDNYGSKLEHDEYMGLDAKGIKNKIKECIK